MNWFDQFVDRFASTDLRVRVRWVAAISVIALLATLTLGMFFLRQEVRIEIETDCVFDARQQAAVCKNVRIPAHQSFAKLPNALFASTTSRIEATKAENPTPGQWNFTFPMPSGSEEQTVLKARLQISMGTYDRLLY